MRTRVEKMAALAMKLGAEHLADHGSIKSRHDFTQRQLMACLILKTCLKCTYHGVIDLLEGPIALRRVLGMQENLPHYTALQKLHGRAEVPAIVDVMIGRLGKAAWRRQMTPCHLKRQGYGRRWHIESLFSALKRCCGSALSAHTHANLHSEAALRVLTCAIHRKEPHHAEMVSTEQFKITTTPSSSATSGLCRLSEHSFPRNPKRLFLEHP